MQWTAWFVLLTLIHWIAIYPVDSVIKSSNNRGQEPSGKHPPLLNFVPNTGLPFFSFAPDGGEVGEKETWK